MKLDFSYLYWKYPCDLGLAADMKNDINRLFHNSTMNTDKDAIILVNEKGYRQSSHIIKIAGYSPASSDIIYLKKDDSLAAKPISMPLEEMTEKDISRELDDIKNLRPIIPLTRILAMSYRVRDVKKDNIDIRLFYG